MIIRQQRNPFKADDVVFQPLIGGKSEYLVLAGE
jgi:hypothetical protein